MCHRLLRKRAASLLVIACASLALRAQAPPQVDLHLQETVLGTLPGTIRGKLKVSPKNRHVFATVQFVDRTAERGAWAVYRDGVLVGRYEGKLPRVSYAPQSSEPGVELRFSPDGEHYAFIGERAGRQFVVHDGIEGPPDDEVSRLTLSPSGTRLAYVTGVSGSRRLVLDGQASPVFSSIVDLQFSPDGTRFAFRTSDQLYVDDAPQVEPGDFKYQIPEGFTFSPDSTRFAFHVGTDKGTRVILDGKVIGFHPAGVGNFIFSPNGQRWAYEAHQPHSLELIALMVDGIATPLSGVDGPLPFLAWSPDSRRLAYAVRRGGAGYPVAQRDLRGEIMPCPTTCWRMVLDGVESAAYFDLDSCGSRFLQDGRLAYSVHDDKGWITFIGDERISGARLVAMTPDGAHRAFALKVPSNPMVIDGMRYSSPASYCCFPRFSGPAGKHFVYGTTYPEDEAFIAIDGGAPLPTGTVVFSSDEDHIAIVRKDSVLVDDAPMLKPGDTDAQFSFDDGDRFHAFALRGNQVIRVDGRF